MHDDEKNTFWRYIDEIMKQVQENEKITIGNDLNEHVGKRRQGRKKVSGGWGLEKGMKQKKRILEFAEAYDLGIVNTIFKKRAEHIITYKNEGNKSQVDYLLIKKKC